MEETERRSYWVYLYDNIYSLTLFIRLSTYNMEFTVRRLFSEIKRKIQIEFGDILSSIKNERPKAIARNVPASGVNPIK